MDRDVGALGFDPDALKQRYEAERLKRLRADGEAQYTPIRGRFAGFLDDPHASPGYSRAPLDDEVEVAVIGGGLGGLILASHLKRAGIDDVRVVEKASDFGGTWYWNRYPGVACDIESYIYIPLLEELGYVPREKYATGAEILAHAKAIARHYGLYEKACLGTEVLSLDWNDKTHLWTVRTNRDDTFRARYVCLVNGSLSRPKLPGIKGIERFAGTSFHTSRWDYGYTGGSAAGGLDGLGDKRVGIIGTGATAVQCIPHLAASAKSLSVFQRTPSSVDVRNNRPTDSAWADALAPGWQKARMDNFNVLMAGGLQDEDLVSDGWTDIIHNLLELTRRKRAAGEVIEDRAALLQLADFRKMEQIRARIDHVVRNPTTAAALKPYYNQLCKRPCFHDEYLQSFNRPNVQLIDTDGKGVDEITETGVVVDGREYPVDCLIFATGFELGTGDAERSGGYPVRGRDGLTLRERWADGVETLHGLMSHGFPNCFINSNSQSGFSVNFSHMLDERSRHVAYIISEARRRGATAVEPTQEAAQRWVETIITKARTRQKFREECTPGYYNNEGQISPLAARNGSYDGGPVEFVRLLEAWREDGHLAGLKLAADPAASSLSKSAT